MEEEKKKELVENINQYNYLLGNFINIMEDKKDKPDTREEDVDSFVQRHFQLTKVTLQIISLKISCAFSGDRQFED